MGKYFCVFACRQWLHSLFIHLSSTMLSFCSELRRTWAFIMGSQGANRNRLLMSTLLKWKIELIIFNRLFPTDLATWLNKDRADLLQFFTQHGVFLLRCPHWLTHFYVLTEWKSTKSKSHGKGTQWVLKGYYIIIQKGLLILMYKG